MVVAGWLAGCLILGHLIFLSKGFLGWDQEFDNVAGVSPLRTHPSLVDIITYRHCLILSTQPGINKEMQMMIICDHFPWTLDLFIIMLHGVIIVLDG